MRFSAVIFDLFGTIVKDITGPPYDRAVKQMASVLSVNHADLNRLWFDTVYERNTGHFSTIEENIEYICHQLGTQVHQDQVSAAAKIRHNLAKEPMMDPRAGSLDILSELRNNNYKIGLISDCSPAEPEIWLETPFEPLFDVTVFSCLAKLKKPDPAIYTLAANLLEVQCTGCVYVGNGGSDELRGAFLAGMFPVLILPEKNVEPYLQPDKSIRDFALQKGAIISSFDELMIFMK